MYELHRAIDPITCQTRGSSTGQPHGSSIEVGQLPRVAWAFRTRTRAERPVEQAASIISASTLSEVSNRPSRVDRDHTLDELNIGYATNSQGTRRAVRTDQTAVSSLSRYGPAHGQDLRAKRDLIPSRSHDSFFCFLENTLGHRER